MKLYGDYVIALPVADTAVNLRLLRDTAHADHDIRPGCQIGHELNRSRIAGDDDAAVKGSKR